MTATECSKCAEYDPSWVTAVQRSLEGLGRVRTQMVESASVVKDVGRRTGEISSIVDTINLIAERTKDGIAAARARGKHPGRQPLDADKIAAALKLVKAGLSPTAAARQLGLGRSTVYREVRRAGIDRLPHPA